jgi:hypothetical protein
MGALARYGIGMNIGAKPRRMYFASTVQRQAEDLNPIRAGSLKEIAMDTKETMDCGSMAADEARADQFAEYESMEIHQTTRTISGLDIRLNEVAAGALCKAVDTAAAITQFAVSVPIGIGIVTLDSVGKWVANGSESVSTQFNTLVNRVFKVRKG